MGILSRKHLSVAGAAAIALVAATPAVAQQRTFDVPAQPANKAIPEFARQAGVQIVAPGSVLRGKRTQRVKGELDVRAALTQLLDGTDLRIASDDGTTITLARRDVGNGQGGAEAASSSGEGGETADIVVTGALIHGATGVVPVTTFTRKDFDNAGATTLEQFASRIPQNFGNIAGEGNVVAAVTGPFSPGASSDSSGSRFNLRGLGGTSTLTLIDGQRTVAAGQGAGFVDISLLPLSAVERVDVMSDGTSALNALERRQRDCGLRVSRCQRTECGGSSRTIQPEHSVPGTPVSTADRSFAQTSTAGPSSRI